MFQTNLEEIEGQNNNKIIGVPENKTWFKKCRNQTRHTEKSLIIKRSFNYFRGRDNRLTLHFITSLGMPWVSALSLDYNVYLHLVRCLGTFDYVGPETRTLDRDPSDLDDISALLLKDSKANTRAVLVPKYLNEANDNKNNYSNNNKNKNNNNKAYTD